MTITPEAIQEIFSTRFLEPNVQPKYPADGSLWDATAPDAAKYFAPDTTWFVALPTFIQYKSHQFLYLITHGLAMPIEVLMTASGTERTRMMAWLIVNSLRECFDNHTSPGLGPHSTRDSMQPWYEFRSEVNAAQFGIKFMVVCTASAASLLETELGTLLQAALQRFVALSDSAVSDALTRGSSYKLGASGNEVLYKMSGGALEKAKTFMATQLAWIKTPVGIPTETPPALNKEGDRVKNSREGEQFYTVNTISYDGNMVLRLFTELGMLGTDSMKDTNHVRTVLHKFTEPYWVTLVSLTSKVLAEALSKQVNTQGRWDDIRKLLHKTVAGFLLTGAVGDLDITNPISAFKAVGAGYNPASDKYTSDHLCAKLPTLLMPETWNGKVLGRTERGWVRFISTGTMDGFISSYKKTPIMNLAAFRDFILANKEGAVQYLNRHRTVESSVAGPKLGNKFVDLPRKIYPRIEDHAQLGGCDIPSSHMAAPRWVDMNEEEPSGIEAKRNADDARAALLAILKKEL